jgi:hypothetical protein
MWRGIRIAAVGGAMSALFSLAALAALAQEPALQASNNVEARD